MEENSQIDPIALYGFQLFATESGTEGGDETNSDYQTAGLSKGSAFKSRPGLEELSDLVGRSRAILREYFGEASQIRLHVGHSTIAFTEPQQYHLRVLADEALVSRSFSTMQRMVIDAVRGSPTVVPSRTAHFKTKGRCQTPMWRAKHQVTQMQLSQTAMILQQQASKNHHLMIQGTHLFMERAIVQLKWTS